MTLDIKLEFRECDTCRAKPGAPMLCQGCLHNRIVIERLVEAATKRAERKQVKKTKRIESARERMRAEGMSA